MAIVADLYKYDQLIGEPLNLDAGNCRYVTRVLQQAGLLPKVKRGQTPPEINADHCASFLLGIAGTGTVGEAAEAAKRFRALRRLRKGYGAKTVEKKGHMYFKKLPREAFCRLHDDLVDLINEAREQSKTREQKGDWGWNNQPGRLIFGHDPHIPYAEIQWPDGRVWRYTNSETGVFVRHVYQHAALFDGGMIGILALLLEGDDPDEGRETG